MADKKTHFGRAGEFFAMSELLLRGWNVAVPVVDIGDDVFVIDDRDKATRRVQVKTSATEADEAGRLRATFNLSREQLRTPQLIELFYMLMMRAGPRWRFLVIPRVDLFELRSAYVDNARMRQGPGRRPLGDEAARTDGLILTVELDGDGATGWDASLGKYLEAWPDDLWVVEGGPGSVGESAEATSAEDPAPSRGRGR
jgi:hypothetical protein